MKILLVLIALVVVFYLSTLNWRRSVKSIFVLLVFEGVLRKWVLPQASEFIYFLKDFVLLGAYLRYFVFAQKERKFPIRNDVITVLILLVSLWCVFQTLNPSLGSPIVGLLGLKGYLMYVPMMWMLPSLFRDEEEFYIFLRNHLLLIFPTGILGIIQFFSPPDSPWNIYAPGIEMQVATFGVSVRSAVRVTGMFSFIQSYQGYLIACFGLLLPMLSRKKDWFWQLIMTMEMLLVAANILMTGSRTPLFGAGIVLSGYLLMRIFADPYRTLRLIQQLAGPIIATLILLPLFFAEAINQFQQRLAKVGRDITFRVRGNFLDPFGLVQLKELDGFGTGAYQAGTPVLRRVLNLPMGERVPPVEVEMGRVILELGPIGFTLWYLLRLCIALSLFATFLKLKNSFLRELALVAFLIQAVQFPSHLVFHHTFAVYYWFLSGFVFLLPHLERIEEWRVRHPQLFQRSFTSRQPHGQTAYLSGSSHR